MLLATLAACAGDPRDATLRELFLAHEHPRMLVVWAEPRDPGPVFAELGGDAVPERVAPPASVGGVPVVAVRRRELDALFGAHPDGWKAFYERYRGATGLVEISPVRTAGDSATLVVGRSCGEHCRTAWRVRLSRAGGAWRVTRVQFVAVPNA
jgi:hypothetical protein